MREPDLRRWRSIAMAVAAAVLAAFAGGQALLDGEGRQTGAAANSGRASGFDYYVLALSWSPSFCLERPDAQQCEDRRRFILHGLWPQNERGYPEDCRSAHDEPSRSLLRRYADLTESPGLLAHQWRRHGACSGLSPEAYFETSARAVAAVSVPAPLERVSQDLDVDPRVVETAFLEANPDFERDGITIKCRDNRLSEVRICLTKDLEPRACGRDVVRDCGARMIDLPAPK